MKKRTPSFFFENGLPTPTLGEVGDRYEDLDTHMEYRKTTASGWVLEGSGGGGGSSWTVGDVDPPVGWGQMGDWYYNQITGDLFYRNISEWELVGYIPTSKAESGSTFTVNQLNHGILKLSPVFLDVDNRWKAAISEASHLATPIDEDNLSVIINGVVNGLLEDSVTGITAENGYIFLQNSGFSGVQPGAGVCQSLGFYANGIFSINIEEPYLITAEGEPLLNNYRVGYDYVPYVSFFGKPVVRTCIPLNATTVSISLPLNFKSLVNLYANVSQPIKTILNSTLSTVPVGGHKLFIADKIYFQAPHAVEGHIILEYVTI